MIRHTKHYFRAGFLILGGLIVFLIVRVILIPNSFGQYGHFRGDNLKEQQSKPIVFGEKYSCAECHSDIVKTHKEGGHHTVQCQNCHAPLDFHIREGAFQEAMPIERSPKLCLRCHAELPSRPKNFPQIDVQEHLDSFGQTFTTGVCLNCHQPHDPPGGKKE